MVGQNRVEPRRVVSLEAGQAAAEGIRRVYEDADICIRPLADGGEGTVEALVRGMGGELKRITVTGPLGKPVVCEYGIIKESGTAVIEMAGAAGITMVDEECTPREAKSASFAGKISAEYRLMISALLINELEMTNSTGNIATPASKAKNM